MGKGGGGRGVWRGEAYQLVIASSSAASSPSAGIAPLLLCVRTHLHTRYSSAVIQHRL